MLSVGCSSALLSAPSLRTEAALGARGPPISELRFARACASYAPALASFAAFCSELLGVSPRRHKGHEGSPRMPLSGAEPVTVPSGQEGPNPAPATLVFGAEPVTVGVARDLPPSRIRYGGHAGRGQCDWSVSRFRPCSENPGHPADSGLREGNYEMHEKAWRVRKRRGISQRHKGHRDSSGAGPAFSSFCSGLFRLQRRFVGVRPRWGRLLGIHPQADTRTFEACNSQLTYAQKAA
jgi:hypothetical protein